MRAYAHWYAVVLVGAMVAAPEAQQGQGANIGSNDATAVLRSGPLSRMPGEPVQILSTMPDRFPRELLPEGAAFAAAATSPSLTVVVMTLAARERFDFYKYQWRLEELGWINVHGSRFGFAINGPGGGQETEMCKAGEFAQAWVETRPSGGVDETQAASRLETTLSPESLAANFIGQMKEAGWRLESGPLGDGIIDASIRVVRNKPSR